MVYLPKGIYNNVHFIKAVFLIVQTRNNLNVIKNDKLYYSHTIQYYTLIGRNVPQVHKTIWMVGVCVSAHAQLCLTLGL